MKIKQTLFGIVAGACLMAASPLQSAAFMKIEGIDGEATDANHDKWIDVLTIDWGVKRTIDPATGRLGPPNPAPFTCTKELDKSSPKLQESCVMGSVIPKLEIEFTATYGGSRAVYLKYELTNVMVTSYSISGSGAAGQVPTEDFSLNFETIKVTYTERDSTGAVKGNVETTWKVEEGTT